MRGVDYDEVIGVFRRLPVLAACRGEPRSRRELVERADLSRTTAYRATTELTDRGLLIEENGDYTTTTRGVALVEAADRFRDAIETADRLAPLFELVDHPELIANAHRLGNAEVVVADASNPYRVVERSIERLERTSRSRGTLGNPTAVEAIRQSTSITPDLEEFERIFTVDSLEAHASIGTGEFDDVVSQETIDLLVAPADAVPFSFAIDDEDVSIVGHDPQTGLPTVHVESAAPAARTWLEDVYDRCRARAEPASIG